MAPERNRTKVFALQAGDLDPRSTLEKGEQSENRRERKRFRKYRRRAVETTVSIFELTRRRRAILKSERQRQERRSLKGNLAKAQITIPKDMRDKSCSTYTRVIGEIRPV